MISRRIFAGCIGLVSAFWFAPGHAQGDLRIDQVLSSPAAMAKAVQDGKKAAFFCANCHGETGNSAYDYIPNLAGQHPAYLLNQIHKFADGRRQDDFMSGMIKVMKEEERFNIAIYYSAQQVQPASSEESAQTARGKALFSSICSNCHGARGYGSQTTARLAGQHALYLRQSLEKYRAGAKERSDPVMGSIARRLNDTDIAAVAAYIATMK